MNSLWINSTKDNLSYSKLTNDISTDICVIGGGILGLTTAYYLSKQNKKVIVLEQESGIGLKTSGHTTGKITSQHGLFYSHLVKDFGEKFAKKYLKSNEEAIQNIKNIIDEEQIDCDFEWQDNYVYTTKLDETSKINEEALVAKSLGVNATLLNSIDLPLDITAAVKFPSQAQFNPQKYMLGLGRCIINSGNSIYTNSKVTDIAKDGLSNGYIVFTENANIKAKKIVIASHYPFINIPRILLCKDVSIHILCNSCGYS